MSEPLDLEPIKARLCELNQDIEDGGSVDDAAPTLCFRDIPALIVEVERLRALIDGR